MTRIDEVTDKKRPLIERDRQIWTYIEYRQKDETKSETDRYIYSDRCIDKEIVRVRQRQKERERGEGLEGEGIIKRLSVCEYIPNKDIITLV